MSNEPRWRPDGSRLLGNAPAGASSGSDPIVSLCSFEVGREAYVLDLLRVREILRPMKVTPVPKAPPFLEGVIHLRGSVIPVVDLRRRLGVSAEPAASELQRRFVICWVGRRQVGLIVDRVTEVLRIPRSQILRTPDLWLEGGARYFLGVCGEPPELKLLLNLKALLISGGPVPPPESRRLPEGPAR